MIFGDYVTEGCSHPFLTELNDHVVQGAAVKWRDLGFQLLNAAAGSASTKNILDIIEANHRGVSNFVSNSKYVTINW